VIRQTNWWQVGGKKPSLLRYSDGCLPRKLTDGYRLSRLACEAIRCRLGFVIDGDGVNLIYPAGPRSSAACRARAEGEGEMMIGPRPTGLRWTPAEDAQLLALLDSKMDRPSIARKLKRTVSAIAKQRSILKKRRLVELGLKAKGK
jgi:hypothetical protein